MNPEPIPLTAIAVVSTEQVSTTLGGEVVILGLQDSVYYGLEEVGTLLWSLLQTPRSVADLVEAVVAEYDVDPAAAVDDVRALLNDLASRRLVAISCPEQ
jgi:hypothetical protein